MYPHSASHGASLLLIDTQVASSLAIAGCTSWHTRLSLQVQEYLERKFPEVEWWIDLNFAFKLYLLIL